MIVINNLGDLKKYLKVKKEETTNLLFGFYNGKVLDDVIFTKDFNLDSFSILQNEENLDKIANTVVKIKANSIKAHNLTCDYIYVKQILCKNLQITYNLECRNIKAENIESINVKAKHIETQKILSSYIECENLICKEADFYELNASNVKADSLKGIILNSKNVECNKINVKTIK
ncbi:MAG: hypothetical protein IJW82_02970 [Clostridia bacterium]|nr:hypothetical protein [Clostridia bacterium]